MLKKVIAIVFSAALFFGLGSPAFANENKDVDKAISMIEKTNIEIHEKVEKAVEKADKLQVEYIEDIGKLPEGSTETHQKLTQKYNEKLDKIIADVYEETLKMSQKTIAKAAEYGVTAECSWVLVRFADRYVWIDPVRVVGLGK
ncbi:hypothetical protein DRW41_05805 [Neobacillus piezotolerans]|uniref:DUF3347 domain-containing protein n=1 Tax=Neobacillus piezotolerans TaxID=2259171 RepID=A0A3D8GSB4_9BACI|nr:hypothetical protein [Neobacillus piezotolerans]RDU37360.1 hypothetical protein DRW41_05805 [Neobacillus piezotolerans]